MGKVKVEDLVAGMAEPIVKEAGMELVDVEFVKEGAHWYIRVYIDKPGGVDLDDCEAISVKLGPELDKRDPVEQEYMLEVSSPGLDRPLKRPEDFEKFKGRTIKIKTFAPFNGKKEFIGALKGLEEDQVLLEIAGEQISIPREKTSSIRLEIEF